MLKRTLWFTAIAGTGMTVMAPGLAGAQAVPAPTPAPAAAPVATPSAAQTGGTERRAGDLPGPIDSIQDIQDSLKMAFMAADQNHDGQLSQQEAIDAGNMLVGGIFFSTDADGDGKVTQQEAQAARQKVMQQNPLLRFVLQRARNSRIQSGHNEPGAVANIANALDANNDKALSAPELRQAVQAFVQATFATADTNHDGQLSPTELNAAVYGAARAGVQAAFQAADTDKNNALSKEEFTRALTGPTNTAFDVLDANLDGQLTLQELDQAARTLGSQLRAIHVPQAENSATRLIREGRRPEEVAPVPNIQVPASVTNRNPNQ
jgi:Ca2+-binding EF-hand superfamily protein